MAPAGSCTACPPQHWQLGSWAHSSLSGFFNFKNLARNLSHGLQPAPPLGRITSYSPEGGLLLEKTRRAIVGLPGLHPTYPWTCLHGTGLMGKQPPPSRPPRRKPVRLTVPSCELTFKNIVALYCSNQYAQCMLNVHEDTLLFLVFENVRSIFLFISVELKKDLKKKNSRFKLLRPFVLVYVGHLQLSNLVGQ